MELSAWCAAELCSDGLFFQAQVLMTADLQSLDVMWESVTVEMCSRTDQRAY